MNFWQYFRFLPYLVKIHYRRCSRKFI